MSRFCGENKVDAIFSAAETWKKRCLLADGAVFSDDSVWNLQNLMELDKFFVNNPDSSNANFLTKLERQLSKTSSGTKRLAAEMRWVMMLFPSQLKPDTKREDIRTIYKWSGLEIPKDHFMLSDEVLDGVGHSGIAFMAGPWRELAYLVRVTIAFKKLPSDKKESIIKDPWIWSEWLEGAEKDSNRSLYHMLSFLIFPDYFERIASGNHKCNIIASVNKTSFKEVYKNSWREIDQRLYQIRQEFQKKYNTEQLDFYDSPLKELWQRDGTEKPGKNATRYWLYAPGENARYWDDFYNAGLIGIGWDELGDLSKYATKEEVAQALRDTYGESDSSKKNDATACFSFAQEIQIGDIVFVKQGISKIIGLGVIDSDYSFDATRKEYKHIRKAVWKTRGNWVVSEDKKFALKTLTEITQYTNFVSYLTDLIEGKTSNVLKENQIAYGSHEPVYPIEKCSEDSGYSKEAILYWTAAIERKRQAVFFGPPGTGKTFLAHLIAKHIVGGTDGIIDSIQFHPAYSYEDFIQGIRPETDDNGNLHYNLKPGRFLEFCSKARQRKDPCVLIIDELNRANIARVFGELMYLLEYRDKEMPLSGGIRFSIPKNVRVIGTMNTADRSIALVDFALRRRFAFIELSPEYDILRVFQQKKGFNADGLIRVLKDINNKISDKNYYIGISFFMIENLRGNIKEIWQMEIETYLEEYFFGQDGAITDYRWDKVAESVLA